MLALLNARLIDWFYKVNFQAIAVRGGYIEFREFLKYVPIPGADPAAGTDRAEKEQYPRQAQAALETNDYQLVLQLARGGLVAQALAVTQHLPPWTHEHFSEEEIEELRDFPGREDFVHDLLAELAQRMIDLNRDKHDLIERFQADLRGLVDADTSEKLQKGKQARTLFKHESCQPFVEEGSHSTHSLHESLAWSEEAFEVFVRELAGKVPNLSDLLAAYRTYADDYRGLTEALTRTDDLIDQIVYALYGLTEQEIRIVEQSVKR